VKTACYPTPFSFSLLTFYFLLFTFSLFAGQMPQDEPLITVSEGKVYRKFNAETITGKDILDLVVEETGNGICNCLSLISCARTKRGIKYRPYRERRGRRTAALAVCLRQNIESAAQRSETGNSRQTIRRLGAPATDFARQPECAARLCNKKAGWARRYTSTTRRSKRRCANGSTNASPKKTRSPTPNGWHGRSPAPRRPRLSARGSPRIHFGTAAAYAARRIQTEN